MNRVIQWLAPLALLSLLLGSCDDDGGNKTPAGNDTGSTFADNTATPDPGPTKDLGPAPDYGPAPDLGGVDPGPPDPGNPLASCNQEKCDFSCAQWGGPKANGEACSKDSDCDYGICMLPETEGNITNERFGFCTRGCNCGGADSQLSDDEKADGFICLLVYGNEGRWRHVVKTCSTANDCMSMDPQWNTCQMPSSGAAYKVCHAL